MCKACSKAQKNAFRILSPAPSAYVAEDPRGVELELSPGAGAQWFVDGAFLGESPGKQLFAPGRHRVEAVRTGDSAVDAVVFTVSEKK
jgi:hypothetical protein